MRAYELVLVLRAEVSEIEKKKVLDEVLKLLGEAKSEIQEWGRKTLAYPIKKEREGIFVLLNISYPNGSSIPADLEKKLLMNEKVLRHLLIRTKDKKEIVPKVKKIVLKVKSKGRKDGSKKS